MEDIHDIRPPVEVGMDPWVIKAALIALAVLAAAALAVFLYRRYRKRKQAIADDLLLLPPPLPPVDAAIRELESMKSMIDTVPRLFCFHLIHILKTYFGRTYGVRIPEMTNQETVNELRRLDMDRKHVDGIRAFFESTESITYAGGIPESERLEKDWQFVRQLIVTHAGQESQAVKEV